MGVANPEALASGETLLSTPIRSAWSLAVARTVLFGALSWLPQTAPIISGSVIV
jgi:hypothetical protein